MAPPLIYVLTVWVDKKHTPHAFWIIEKDQNESFA